MQQIYINKIAQKMGIEEWQVSNTIGLLQYGATIPFISRYRKEATGSLDEVQIEEIYNSMKSYEELEQRREYILKTIEKQGQLSDELKLKIENAQDITTLEDIYLPYKPKRKTRAVKAIEKGLEPLANEIFTCRVSQIDLLAEKFITEEVPDIESALQGARDIIAEKISEDPLARNSIRKIFAKKAMISSKVIKGKEAEAIKYKDYFDWKEKLARIPSHRFLAIMRAEKEKLLKVNIFIDKEEAFDKLKRLFVRGSNESAKQVEMAVEDTYERLLKPSIETEFKNSTKEKADDEAIKVFRENLRHLLLAPPLGKKRVLAIDPGFRTGCKTVTIDEQGNLMHNETIYPFGEREEIIRAIRAVSNMVEQYKIDVIAIGNGTASKETEKFIQKVRFKRDVKAFMVDESGASIYSASKNAREEFPDYDVTVRGAVSIGRRLLDPLSELVKIDPKSIGVGQYQHDVNQKKLKQSLDNEVESCVNLVGVDVNTASKYLLTYVSGLGNTLAENIVSYRTENGRFKNRKEFKKVKGMGPKSFEQSAGFLRITDGENPLDASAVHPESYYIVEKMAKDLNVEVAELLKNKEIQKKITPNAYIDDKTGKETLKDIMSELAKPGRDPRKQFKAIQFAEGINGIDDLQEGMILPGIVKNVTKFGAFIDIGIKINGLLHVSQMADRYISNPNEIVKVHQPIKVKVISIDTERQRIGLSIKGVNQEDL